MYKIAKKRKVAIRPMKMPTEGLKMNVDLMRRQAQTWSEVLIFLEERCGLV
jgi:hypothetical protein